MTTAVIETLSRLVPPTLSAAEITLRILVVLLWCAGGVSIRAGLTRRTPTIVVLSGVTAIVALALGWRFPWVADDAHISFRYAKHLADGFGLVWNVGERVEGYTNFLWTVIMAAGEYMLVPAPQFALVLNSAWVVAFAFIAPQLLIRALPTTGLCVPLILLSPAFSEFTTSGLESAPAALTTAIAALLLLRNSTEAWAPLAVLVASLLRPDQALLFAPLAILAIARGVRTHLFVATAAAGVAFGLFWACRWSYYGMPFPNTFYAKSANLSYWGQGTFYLFLLAVGTGLGIALCLHLPRLSRAVAACVSSVRGEQAGPARAMLLAASGLVLFCVYTAKVGGDFMQFRFGLTPFALAMVALELTYYFVPMQWTRRGGTVLGVSFLALTVTPDVIRGSEKYFGVAVESRFYPVSNLRPFAVATGVFDQAQSLKRAFPTIGVPAPMLALGSVGMVGYYNPYLRIFDTWGLNTATVARTTIMARGRPGHEKFATPAQIIASDAMFTGDPVWGEEAAAATAFSIDAWRYWLLRDDPAARAAFPPAILPNLASFLDKPRTRGQAAALWGTVRALYRATPEVAAIWGARWQLLDPTELTVQGAAEIERGDGKLRSSGSVALSTPYCRPNRSLGWRVESGSCDASQIDCANQTVVRCEGTPVVLSEFHWKSGSGAERLVAALTQGPYQGAVAIRDELDDDSTLSREATYVNTFDAPEDLLRPEVRVDGDALAIATAPVAGQLPITGYRGRGYLNSFARGGDEPTGTAEIVIPVTIGDSYLVSFAVGGGGCDLARVEIPELKSTTCGTFTEALHLEAIAFTATTSSLHVRVVDGSRDGWGHILFDDLILWRTPNS